MYNIELARTLSWRELEIANTKLWAKWKGKTHFSRNGKEQYKSFVISVMSQLRRKTTKNKEDATKCLLHPPPCVGLIFLLLLPSALPFSHTKGVKILASLANYTLGRELKNQPLCCYFTTATKYLLVLQNISGLVMVSTYSLLKSLSSV